MDEIESKCTPAAFAYYIYRIDSLGTYSNGNYDSNFS